MTALMPKPTKRTALEVLTKKRLAQLVQEFGLDVPGSRPKAELVEAIAQAKTATFADVLRSLRRSESRAAGAAVPPPTPAA